MRDFQGIDANVKDWLRKAREIILDSFNLSLDVETKSGPTDLVTNVDKEVERFYIQQIQNAYPEAKILGEETSKIHPLTNMEGLVFILDPIDGTMNFVKQKRNFASMIAVYYNNRPLLGYIYDIIRDELYWGGPVYDAVYCNDYQLATPTDSILSEGLVQLCRSFVMNDSYGFRRVVDASAGLRMYGCAGLEFINVLTGRCICYASALRPWDLAAGKILAETLDLVVETIDVKETNMLSSKVVLVATKNAEKDITKLISI